MPGLVNGELPAVRQANGGQGLSILLFDTEEQARQAAEATTRWSAPGISIDGVEIRRVAVSVP